MSKENPSFQTKKIIECLSFILKPKNKFKFLLLFILFQAKCNIVPSQTDQNLQKQNLLLQSAVLYKEQELNSLSFELNGNYLSYSGSSTSTTTNTYISAVKGKTGLWLDDTGNGDTTFTNVSEFSNCYLIETWNATSKYLITRNPPNNGSCYADNTGYIYGFGSNSNNTYNKIYWSYSGSNIYYCTTAFGKTTLALAESDTTAPDSSKYDTTGCGGFAWSRLVKQ
jgi:hypothetical protein